MQEKRESASLRRDQRGLSTVEYVLLFVLIIGTSVSVWSKLGGSVKGKLDATTTAFDTTVK